MVRIRAISCRVWRSLEMSSSAPVAAWKRMLNSSLRVSTSRCARSSAVMFLSSLARKEITAFPAHELRLHRQLLPGEAERLLGERLRHAGELEHHATRLDDRDPALGRALALAHAGLGRLLGVGLVGEDVDPHLPTAADLAGHRNTGGLDLAVGDPAVLEGLDPVLAELHGRLALGLAAAPAA